MEKWEHLCVSIDTLNGTNEITRELNYFATQGWELVCVYGHLHYFKRRKA